MTPSVILPGATVGILGSGQLSRLFAIAAISNTRPALREKLHAYRCEWNDIGHGPTLP